MYYILSVEVLDIFFFSPIFTPKYFIEFMLLYEDKINGCFLSRIYIAVLIGRNIYDAIFCQLSLLKDLFCFVESICFKMLKVFLVLIAKMPCHHSQATEL